MRCPGCQQDNPPQARFCLACGVRLALRCDKCGVELPGGARFCLQCGEPFTARSTVESRFPSPEAYTPKHLAQKILTSKSALEGERKQVTVLFADLKGSLALLADRDPEEARKILDPVLERMMEAVHRYEGTVNQVMGDGIMALFGAPVAHEDHAVRSCYAALQMQESVRRYAEGVRRTEGIPIQIRVGLNSGEVVVRAIGSDLHMDYTAVGQTTHLAARMEQMAVPGSILISADTMNLAEGYVQVKPLGPLPIKGLEAPIEVYEILGAGMARSRMEAAAARGLTRFVGRDAEIDALRQALERGRAGHGQIVGVVGEPGVGKSRLFWEFIHSHRTHGWLVLESSSASYGKATPYLPVIDLLKAYCQVEPRDDGRKICEKLTGKLLALDRALEPTLPAFLALLDVPVEDPQWQTFDPPQRRQRTLDALKRLLFRESQVQPLCLVLEDLHWIDSETQAFLDSLIESLPTARVLLLVNYRPEYQHGWGSKTYYTQLRIDPLPPESCEELLHALVGDGADLQPLKQRLIAQTQGNPFFLEESVRTLVETQALVGERGAYRLAKALPGIQVPATVQAVLAARIDRLPPEDKRVLQAAAVIGEEVPFALLQAIAEEPEEALRLHLTHLQAAEFLYEARLFPDLEYTFKHGLTYQVAYGSLLQDRRRTLHARIVEALERLYPDRLTEHVDRLAHHAFRGEVWDKAATYLRQAGAKALARSAHREAVTCFEQALVALPHLSESRELLEQAIDIRLDLRNALYPLGEFGRILDYLREGEALANTLGDQGRLGWISIYMSTHFWAMGDHERAVESGQQALTIASSLGDLALQVQTNGRLGWVYHVLGDYPRAITFLEKSIQPLKGDLARERLGMPALPFVMSRTYLAWSLAELGAFVEGIAYAEDGLQIAEAVGEPLSRIAGYSGLGALYLSRGDFDKAISLFERGHLLGQVANIAVWVPIMASQLGYSYALSGRVGEALSLLEEALERRATSPFPSLRIGRLGEAYLLAGRMDDASKLAESALSLSRDRKERGFEAWALRLLGMIGAQQDPPDIAKAEAHYREAMALAEELGMRPLVAHCHLGLGRLFRRAGKPQQAQEHLTTATSLFREMEMRFWLAQAEAELKELER